MKSLIVAFLCFISLSSYGMKSLSNNFMAGKYTLYGKLSCEVKSRKCHVVLYPETTKQLSVNVIPISFDRGVTYNNQIIEGQGLVKANSKGRDAVFHDFKIIKIAPDYKAYDTVYLKN